MNYCSLRDVFLGIEKLKTEQGWCREDVKGFDGDEFEVLKGFHRDVEVAIVKNEEACSLVLAIPEHYKCYLSDSVRTFVDVSDIEDDVFEDFCENIATKFNDGSYFDSGHWVYRGVNLSDCSDFNAVAQHINDVCDSMFDDATSVAKAAVERWSKA